MAIAIAPAHLGRELGEIERLIEDVEAIDGHRPIGERKAIALAHHLPDAVGLVGRAGERIVAFVALTPAADHWWAMEMAVDPGFRRQENYRRLFGAAVAEASRRGGKGLRAWLFHPGLATAAVREGFSEERQLYKMECQLPLDRKAHYPSQVVMRSFRPGHDEELWLRLNNQAFAGHPENGSWSPADLAMRMGLDWFAPELLLMAWEGSKLVGFNWLKPGPGEGEIYAIAVSPDFQGQGLGGALLVDGLDRLAKAGVEKAFLYVDADNHQALRLYRGLGFYLDHVDRSFVRAV